MQKRTREAVSALGAGVLLGAVICVTGVLLALMPAEPVPQPDGGTAIEAEFSPTPTPEFVIQIIDEIPTAIEYRPVTPTEPQERVSGIAATNTPSPTPKPVKTPTEAPQGMIKYCEVDNGIHGWKPWAWYTAITVVNSPQYRLQQLAVNDEQGIRIVKDPQGEWRYCVALPVFWAGGTSKDIGKCVNLHMENGAVLKCVLGDTKKKEHSLGGAGLYGRRGELVEVQVDGSKIPAIVRDSGNASFFGDEWRGEVRYIEVFDMYIEGFGGE